jgi:spore coat protein CotH
MAKKGSGAKDGSGEPNIVRANIKRVITQDSNFVSLYSNDTQIQITPWDVRLVFGEISEGATPERPEVSIKSNGQVTMSPQHAKKVAEILISSLAKYEQTFGPLPMPKD